MTWFIKPRAVGILRFVILQTGRDVLPASADGAACDLTLHTNQTGHPLVVHQALKESIITEKEVSEWNQKTLKKTFKQGVAIIHQTVE